MFCICCEFNRNFFPTFVLDGFKSRKRKRNVWHFLLLAINYLIRCKFSVKIVIMLVNRAYTKTNHFDICVVFCLTMHGTVLRKLVSVSKASTLIPEAFFYSFFGKFCDANRFFYFFYWHEALRAEKRKPLVKVIHENLTLMLAQHLTAVKDVIFF